MIWLGMLAAGFEAVVHSGAKTHRIAAQTSFDAGFHVRGKVVHGSSPFSLIDRTTLRLRGRSLLLAITHHNSMALRPSAKTRPAPSVAPATALSSHPGVPSLDISLLPTAVTVSISRFASRQWPIDLRVKPADRGLTFRSCAAISRAPDAPNESAAIALHHQLARSPLGVATNHRVCPIRNACLDCSGSRVCGRDVPCALDA